MDIDNFLNRAQKKATSSENGIFLVHAGAGSGKTRVITSRIISLINNYNIDPAKILALTFTNKAAKEMKERVSSFLKNKSKLPYLGTFHSYCLKLLKSSKHFNPNFSLIDQDDQNKLIKNLIKKNNLEKKINPKQIIAFMSNIKNQYIEVEKSVEFLNANNIYREIYMQYEKEKSISNCLDFDDLIIKTLNLFQNPEFKIKFQTDINHILIDEYQDTNLIQHMLLKEMTLDKNLNFVLSSLCIVGDEDQSIYSWRGANILNMLNFKKDFKDAVSITLDQNYRSAQPILHVANAVISNNRSRNIKNLWSDRQAENRIKVILNNSNYQESNAIAEFLKVCNSNSNAILYRSHFQSRNLEEALIINSIPYKIVGGIQFYDRLEIKDIIAYLRLIINPFDKLALLRIMNSPNRGFGEKFEEFYLNIWDNNTELNFKLVIDYIINNNLLNSSKKEALIKFKDIFKDLDPEVKPSLALNNIILKTDYFDYLDKSFDKEEALSKKENIKELINSAIFFEKNNNFNLKDFLEEISLLQELISSNNKDNTKVYLMTFHAAKGLEFDNVIISGVEEGILPSGQSIYSPESLEEERRLLYVGITRAKERLIITNSIKRVIYGQNSTQKPSRFISELPENYVKKEDCTSWPIEKFSNYFQEWFTKKAVAKEIIINKNSKWQIKQKVNHKKFGIGIIKEIENSNLKTYLTVKFEDQIKKIDSKFLNLVI